MSNGTLVRPIAKTSGLELADAMLKRADPRRRRIIAEVLKDVCILSLDFESATKFRQVEREAGPK